MSLLPYRPAAWLKVLLYGVLALAVACTAIACQPSSTSAPNSQQIVRPAYGTLGELFQNEVIGLGLEELGYDVIDGMEIDYEVFHEAIARSYLEYSASHWETLHQDFFQANANNLVRVGTLIDGAWQGYLIDSKTAQADQISNLEQLQDPNLARQFDLDGNGKADLIGCPQGWGCHEMIEHHLDEYGLRATVEHRTGSYDDAIRQQVVPRVEAGEPVLYYTWTPYWVSGVLEPGDRVSFLEVPYTSLLPGTSDAVETTVDGKNLGFPVDRIQVVANPNFLAEQPRAAKFLEVVQIPNAAVSAQNQRMTVGGESGLDNIRQHAREWVADNRAQFDRWLELARAN